MATGNAAMTVWTGWDVRRGSTAAPQPALGADGRRLYELLALAGRGFRPPQLLTVDDATADEMSGPAPAATSATTSRGEARAVWSMAYRQIAETAPAGDAPYAIYLLGVNPPDGASDAELETFNDFYTNVHLVEVAERRHALRAARYELFRVDKSPAGGAPRFLAVYEVDEAGASQRRHVGPPYSKGPDVWRGHLTRWRLWYRVRSE